MSPRELIIIASVLLSLMMAALWLLQLKTKDAGIVDVGWAFGLGAVAIFYSIFADAHPIRRIIVATLGGVWGFRLAYYLLIDRIIGKDEDGRYQAMRNYWGVRANKNFFFFFQAQAILDILLSLVFLVLLLNPNEHLSIWEYLGLTLWITSIIGESIADKQLSKFRSNAKNKGKTCRVGLWKYSRHPNYFFEWLIWCSYAVMAIGIPNAWVVYLSPVVMYIFISKLTGIPYTELQAIKSRGDDYKHYQETTSVLIPWFPKKIEDK